MFPYYLAVPSSLLTFKTMVLSSLDHLTNPASAKHPRHSCKEKKKNWCHNSFHMFI